MGELLAASNTLGELVPSELLRFGLLASAEPSAAAVAETCATLVGRQNDFHHVAASSLTSTGFQLSLNCPSTHRMVAERMDAFTPPLCLPCSPGQQLAPTGECVDCAAGFFSNDGSVCRACPPGTPLASTVHTLHAQLHPRCCSSSNHTLY